MWLAFDGSRDISAASEQTSRLFDEMGACLLDGGHDWRDAALVYLYLSNMADYPVVNSVYKEFFYKDPPARRVCVCMRVWVCVCVCMRVWCVRDLMKVFSLLVQTECVYPQYWPREFL